LKKGNWNGVTITLLQGCTTRGLDPAPERVISGPHSKLKSRKNFFWITEFF